MPYGASLSQGKGLQNGSGHKTKTPPCPYTCMVKSFEIFSSKLAHDIETYIQHFRLVYHQVCSTDKPSLAFDFSTQESDSGPHSPLVLFYYFFFFVLFCFFVLFLSGEP